MKRKISLIHFDSEEKKQVQFPPFDGILANWESPQANPFPPLPRPHPDLLLDILSKVRTQNEDKIINLKPRMKAKKFLK